MLYKFKSKAAATLIMLGPDGDELLRLLGREPAATGIFEADDLAGALATIAAALQSSAIDSNGGHDSNSVGLRQRLWPMVEMMKRALAARVPITWGV